MDFFLRLAGIGQLVLVTVSLAIPRILGWSEELKQLRPLTRQVFWTYAGYIWGTNLAFGLVSTLLPGELINGSPLAACVTGFITLYWAARNGIQWFYFDRSSAPQGRLIIVAEILLNGLFVTLTIIYAVACWSNLSRGTA